MRSITLMTMLMLAGCDPFGRWPSGYGEVEGVLWDSDVVAASDGLYVRLPYAESLAHVSLDGASSLVDLGGAEPLTMTLTPDESTVLVTSRWVVCENDDPKIETVSDCPDEDQRYDYALDRVEGGAITSTLDVPPHLNAYQFSNSGTTAVAYLDYAAWGGEDLPGGQLVDLTAVSFINLDTNETKTISVGFEATDVIFSEDDSQALVLSRAQAVVVDMSTFEVSVTYPLSLDADSDIEPLAAEFTPDGRYALISIKGETDLYKLDLETESIDIVTLSGRPTDMAVDTDTDQTVIAYSGQSMVEIMDHEYFDLTEIDLDESVDSIVELGGSVLLYSASNDAGHDVYRLNLDTQELTEYVLTNPVDNILVNDSQTLALAVMRPGSGGSSDLEDYARSRWGLGVLNLETDDASSLTLQSEPVGVALVDKDSTTYALLLLADDDQIYVVDLANPRAISTVDLPAAPLSIGTLPDGRFLIAHDASLGLISTLDPTTDPPTLESIGGFATVGLFHDDTLPARGVEE